MSDRFAMKVYLHPNGDGVHSFMVAAFNQVEACGLIGCTVGDFRRFGGRKVDDEPTRRVALSKPRRVWKRKLNPGLPAEPWVLAHPWKEKP